MRGKTRLSAAAAVLLLSTCFGAAPAAESVTLAARGQAQVPVIVAPEAGERVRAAARELAEYLRRISGAAFTIEEGDGTRGVVVGVSTDFPELQLSNSFSPAELSRREEYLLRSSSHGVSIIGATQVAVEHAVWDFLHRLGYRQFFPTEKWEIVPRLETVTVSLDVRESPDYYSRRGPRGASRTLDPEAWRNWHRRNRMTEAFVLQTGHSYGGIISRNQAAFDAHSEFLRAGRGQTRLHRRQHQILHRPTRPAGTGGRRRGAHHQAEPGTGERQPRPLRRRKLVRMQSLRDDGQCQRPSADAGQ